MKSSLADPEESIKLDQALIRTIKRRRGANSQEVKDLPVEEKRVMGRQTIMNFVKELKFFLPSWNNILEALINGKKSSKFEQLAFLEDFIDGFLINIGRGASPNEVKRIFTDHGVDIKLP